MDDYPMVLKPMKQEMQTFAQKIRYNWNGDLDCVLIKLLETYSNAPLYYIVLLFNSPCNTNCTKTQLHNHIQYMWEKKQVKENFVSFVSFAIPMSMPNNIPIFPIIENNHSIIKYLPIVENISIIENISMTTNIPMVDNVPIIENGPMVNGMPIGENVPIVERTWIIENFQIIKELSNCKSQKVSHKKKRFIFNYAPYDETISKITKSHSNVTSFAKAMILLHKFPQIKGTKLQIIYHVKYTNSKNPQVCIPNTKIGSSTKKWMRLLKYQRNTQYLKVINSKEDTCELKDVNTYRKKIQNVPITSCFFYERFFLKQLEFVTKTFAQKNCTILKIEIINHKITTHICSNC